MVETSVSQSLDFPIFDGSGPLYWLFQAIQFFYRSDTLDDHHFAIVVAHLDSVALSWFQLLQKHHPISSWAALAKVVEFQFGPSHLNHDSEAPWSVFADLSAEIEEEELHVDVDNDVDAVRAIAIVTLHDSVLAGVEIEAFGFVVNVNTDAVLEPVHATAILAIRNADSNIVPDENQFKTESESQTLPFVFVDAMAYEIQTWVDNDMNDSGKHDVGANHDMEATYRNEMDTRDISIAEMHTASGKRMRYVPFWVDCYTCR